MRNILDIMRQDTKKCFIFEFLHFWIFELEKKFTYILVNGLIANFEFQSFWAKKVEFVLHGAPILPRSVLKFFWRVSNLLKAKWLK